MHAAIVGGVNKAGHFVYIFDNPELSLRATSGAPVLNSAGEVIAINLGSQKTDGKLLGFGNHVNRFRPYLEAALQRKGLP